MLFCPSCAKGFEYESWLTSHIKEEHPQRYINMLAKRKLERA